MKLKSKIIFVFVFSVIVFIGLGFFIQRVYIFPTYRQIELSEAGKDLCRAVYVFEEYKRLIEKNTSTISDILLSYKPLSQKELKKEDIEKIQKHIEEDNLSFCVFYTDKVDNSWINKNSTSLNVNPLTKSVIEKNKLAYKSETTPVSSKNGFVNTKAGVLLVSSIPLIEGGVIKGSVIAGCLLSQDYIKVISDKIGVPVEINFYSKAEKNNLKKSKLKIASHEYSIYYSNSTESDDILKSYILLPNINNSASIILSTDFSRVVYKEAYSMIDFSIYALIILGVILIFITVFIINTFVVVPIKSLTTSAVKIRKSEDLTLRTGFSKRKDEIGFLAKEFNLLLEQIEHYIENIRLTREDTIFRISIAVDSTDVYGGSHITRVSKMAKKLAEIIGMDKKNRELIGVASTLHDIGKIGIPDAVLSKDGKYTEHEYETMKAHTVIGGKIFSKGGSELVKTAREIALYHHERWDGSGYPEGLKGEEIPISARITSIVDVFDALLAEKPYKKAFSQEEAFNFIENNKKIMFDPEIADAFLEHKERFL